MIAYLGKALLCWVGAFFWMFLTVRRVPDTHAGAGVLFVPTLGLGLWGVTYFYRGSRVVTGAALRTILTTHTTQEGMVDRAATDTFAAIGADNRVEIPVDYAAVVVKFVASLLPYTATWWVLGRDNALVSIIFAVGTIFLAYINGRIIFGHGLALNKRLDLHFPPTDAGSLIPV